MTFEDKYNRYVNKMYDEALNVYLKDEEDFIRDENSDETRWLKDTVGIKQDCKLEDLDRYIESQLALRKKELKKDFDKFLFNINKRSNHNPKYQEMKLDINKICKDMKMLKYETERFILFHEEGLNKYKYLGYVDITDNNFGSVGGPDNYRKLTVKILTKFPECNTIIAVHNHPYFANAIPSVEDGIASIRLKEFLKVLGIRLYDQCVITAMDFYSRRQDEKNKNKNRTILKAKYTSKLKEEVIKSNKYLCYAFMDKKEMLKYEK